MVRRVFYVVLALVVVVVLGTLAVNLPDRALTPEATRWLASPAATAPGDASFTLWALDAPDGVDAAAAGRIVLEAYRGRASEASVSGDWRISRPYVAEPLVLPIEFGCVDPASACVASALSHSRMVRNLAEKRHALLARLDALDRADRIAEAVPPAEPNAPSPQYATLVAAHSLALAVASVDVGDGHLDVALPRLERMTRVARKLAAGCRTLACKATAIGMLRRALLVYSELINQTSSSAALGASLAGVNTALTADERDLAPVLAFEMQIARNLDLALVHARAAPTDPLSQRLALAAAPLLFKADATFNLQATLADLERPLVDQPAQQYGRDSAAAVQAFHRQADDIGHLGIGGLYNPLGKVLAAGLPDISGIADQLHDVEGLQAAMTAKVAMIDHHVTEASAAAFLATRPGGAGDVYSTAPFAWNAAASAIVVPQRGSRPTGLVRVNLVP